MLVGQPPVRIAEDKMTLEEAQDAFIQQYSYLWDGTVAGGINLVGRGNGCLHVGVAFSQVVFHQLPDTFQGWPVKKDFIGEIFPL